MFCGCVPIVELTCYEKSLAGAVALDRAGYQARVVVGNTADGYGHTETQYFKDGKWNPVIVESWGVFPTEVSTIAYPTRIMKPVAVGLYKMLTTPIGEDK